MTPICVRSFLKPASGVAPLDLLAAKEIIQSVRQTLRLFLAHGLAMFLGVVLRGNASEIRKPEQICPIANWIAPVYRPVKIMIGTKAGENR